MRPRPGPYARDLLTLSAQPELAVRATSRLCAQQHPRPGHYVRSVHTTWVLGVRTVHPTQFCTVHCLGLLFGHCSWTLFKSTVHRVKKKNFTQNLFKSTKILKIFLGVI